MISQILIAAALASAPAGQTAPAGEAASQSAITSFDDLPIEEATAPRCGVAFAVVSRWQKAGDARGGAYEDMEESGGREFFVRSVANLMEGRGISREAVAELITREVTALSSDEGAERLDAMMPACLLMKRSAGL